MTNKQNMENNNGIIVKQRVHPLKVQRAKEFRHNMTPMERKLWNCLRNNLLEGYHFRRQQVVDGFILDFYCNPEKLVVEVDGGIHKYTQKEDEEREKIIHSRGLRITRIKNEDIDKDIDNVLKLILTQCQEAQVSTTKQRAEK